MRKRIDKILSIILVVLLAIMVINVLWQVFTRFVIGVPSSFTDELARYLMIWLGVIGAAYVSGRNMHVAIDILQTRANEKNQKRFKRIVYLFIVLFAFFALVIGGLRLVYITYTLDQHSPALQMPLFIVYSCLPISGGLIIYYKVLDFLNI